MSSSSQRSHLISWLIVLLVTLLFRAGILFAFSGNLQADTDSYRLLANNLRQYGVFGTTAVIDDEDRKAIRPTAFRPPLYPLVLDAGNFNTEVTQNYVAVVHLFLGLLTVSCVYVCGLQLNIGPKFSALAAVLTALDPVLLNQSTLMMTETLAGYMAIVAITGLALLQAMPNLRRALLAGVFLGLACLCRPSFLPWTLLAIAAVMLLPAFTGVRVKIAATMSVATAAVLAPWLIRNWTVFDKPIIATTHGGYTLLLGNNPGFYEFLRQPAHRRRDVWDSAELDQQYTQASREFDGDELATDRWAYQQAFENIRQNWSGFGSSCLLRVRRLWQLTPNQTKGGEATRPSFIRYAIGIWYAHIFVAAVIGCLTLRRQLLVGAWCWGGLLCLSVTMLHLLYWSNMRMRGPLMPFVCLLAAAGAARVLAGWNARADAALNEAANGDAGNDADAKSA